MILRLEPETSRPLSAWRYAFVIALIHLVLAMVYAVNTPYLTAGRVFNQGGGPKGIETIDIGAPDEMRHVVLAGRLASGEPYPKLLKDDPRLDFNYQAHQPPLFYFLLSGWMKVVGAQKSIDFAADVQKKEPAEMIQWLKQPRTPEENSEGYKLRFLNALIGAAGVLGVYALGFWATGKRLVGLGAALFAALLPMNLALSGAISNDPLLITLSTWIVALCIRYLQAPHISLVLATGFLTGLALITKTSAFGVFPVLLATAIFAKGLWPLISGVMGCVLAIPTWLRNKSVYGEFLLQKHFIEVFSPRSPLASDLIERLGAGAYWQSVAQLTTYSFIGVFGYMDIFLPETLYTFTVFIVLAICIGSVVKWLRARTVISPATWVIWVFFVTTVILFIQFNLGFFQAQGRYMMPALCAISVAVGTGLYAWFGGKTKNAIIGLGIYLLLLNAFALVTLPDHFAVRTQAPQQDSSVSP
jgi:hypothetical protein